MLGLYFINFSMTFDIINITALFLSSFSPSTPLCSHLHVTLENSFKMTIFKIHQVDRGCSEMTSSKKGGGWCMKNMTLDYEVMRCSKGIHGICSSSSQVLVVLVLSLSLGLYVNRVTTPPPHQVQFFSLGQTNTKQLGQPNTIQFGKGKPTAN